MGPRIRFGWDFVLGSELEIRSSSSIPSSVLQFLALGERSKGSMSWWSPGEHECGAQRRSPRAGQCDMAMVMRQRSQHDRVAGVNLGRIRLGHSSGLGDGLRSWVGWLCLGTGPARDFWSKRLLKLKNPLLFS
jgi:hypothetical protein